MNTKLLLIILILCFNASVAQTYEKDWAILLKKIDAGQNPSIKG